MLPFAIGYAESHYKFKLPWSLISEPWPELLLDAPSRVEPQKSWPLWLVARDADLYPVRIHSVRLIFQKGDQVLREVSIPLDLHLDGAFHFVPIAIDTSDLQGEITIHTWIDAERLGASTWKKVRRVFQEWNYPRLTPKPMRVHFLAYPLPKPEGFWAGETHCHTWHSSDPVEFGAPMLVLQQAALSQGLDYVFTTDHSYDFAFRKDNYRQAIDPQFRWQELQKEAQELSTYPLLIPGEEVSCGNQNGENVHLLVPGFSQYIPGIGDSGRLWFHNHPDLSISQVMQQIGDAPCFAAHPQHPMGWLERKVFRRGPYSHLDIHNPQRFLTGLEFWNGSLDQGFSLGRAFWIQELLQGHPILPIGGNDAHGDLNRATSVRTPLVRLSAGYHRIFGHVRTVLVVENGQVLSAFQKAQKTGKLYITNGPSLLCSLHDSQVHLQAQSTPDLGELESITLFWGLVEGREESQRFPLNCLEHHSTQALPAQCLYVRAECKTRLGYFALSAAQFP